MFLSSLKEVSGFQQIETFPKEGGNCIFAQGSGALLPCRNIIFAVRDSRSKTASGEKFSDC
jgi:hypothetical protein